MRAGTVDTAAGTMADHHDPPYGAHPASLPPLRLLLVLDNLRGHKTPELVCWLVQQGVMPLYTPVAGSWLNRPESIQRILVRRALSGHHPSSASQIIACLEATATGWNPPLRLGEEAASPPTAGSRQTASAWRSGACTHQVVR